jgi:ATP-dependent RNA helicase RhlE
MPADIRELANDILQRPIRVQVAVLSSPVEAIEQSVYFVEKRDKPAMLEALLNGNAVGRALVFTRTKHGADRVARGLTRSGIRAEAIHGNKSQNARQRAMSEFKSNSPPVLVATDLAARGLDIDEVSHVINYDMPNVPETYVHRIGRTGRAGASGLAVSFCDSQERPLLQDIERLIRKPIPVCHTPRLPAPARVSDARPSRAQRATAVKPQLSARQAWYESAPTGGGTAVVELDPTPVLYPSTSRGGSPRPVGIGYRSRGRSTRRRGLVRKGR